MTKPNHKIKLLIGATFLVAVSVGAWFGGRAWSPAPGQSASAKARTILFYQDSMHPWVKSDKPGKCSVCGMDLTPIYQDPAGIAGGSEFVALNSNNITVLNVQTEEVKTQAVSRTLQVAGTLEADETKKTIVAAPAAGRIDDLTIRYAGVDVKEGERLVTFYSPELTLEKRRFLVRARMSVQRDPTGGMAMTQSDSDPYYSDLVSPQSGTVVERKVYKGQYVTDGAPLFTILDLSVLWFRFDVYEHQLPWLAVGQSIKVRVAAVPGKVFPAVITFIEPMLNESTRTIKVRADLQNPIVEVNGSKQRQLGLGMFAQGEVRAELQNTLAVPRTAVLQPGRSAYAYVDQGNGVYQRRTIRLGHQGDGFWEVVQGLAAGERVVTSGNVLLDAQAQFNQTGDTTLAEPETEMVDEKSSGAPALLHSLVPESKLPLQSVQMMVGDAPATENPAAQPQPLPAMPEMVPLAHGKAKPVSTHDINLHQPVQPRVSVAHPEFRNTRLRPADDAMDSTFSRMVELRNRELGERAATNATVLSSQP